MARKTFRWLFVCACLLLPSCKQSDHEVAVTGLKSWDEVVTADSKEFLLSEKHQPKTVDAFSLKEKEAKLFDVPVPFGVEPIDEQTEQSSADTVVLAYSTALTYDELTKFYQAEMERLGWRQSAVFRAAESLLQFDKPERLCSVSIRSEKIKRKKAVNRLTIFVGPRAA